MLACDCHRLPSFKPETLLAWNRRQVQQKWTFGKPSKEPERPLKAQDIEALIYCLYFVSVVRCRSQ
jgi:hypothetical protein